MHDITELDNPIWSALNSVHAGLARPAGDARRYPSDVSPLAGVQQATPAALRDLLSLMDPSEHTALFTTQAVVLPDEARSTHQREIDQMICLDPALMPARAGAPDIRRLTEADVPDMLALTALTKPGPFLTGTIRMGRYFGIRSPDGQLAAMTGERLNLADFTEVSAVCTHPAHRGRAYAKLLVAHVAAMNISEGKTPFLHVNPENHSAKAVYHSLGFRFRSSIHVTVLARP